jgi:hypothetical protein
MTARPSRELASVSSTASTKPAFSAFLRFAKIKSEAKVLAAAKHNLREIPCTPNITPQHSYLNEVLVGPTTATAVKSQFKALLAGAGITKLRKDAVLLIEAIVSLPVGVDDHEHQYFQSALEWLEHTLGQGNLLSAILHKDESAQHMHVLIVPLVNGAMNGSDLLGGRHHMRALQCKFRKAMQPAIDALGVQVNADPFRVSEAEMAQQVQAHLKNSRDPVFKSLAWQPIRDCIERHPRLFYEYLGCPALPPRPSTARAVRPRKHMPTMAEIFTRRVGKLRGAQVERYRDSQDYKRAHAVFVKASRKNSDEIVQSKQQAVPAKRVVRLSLAAPPFTLRTLCSVGFAEALAVIHAISVNRFGGTVMTRPSTQRAPIARMNASDLRAASAAQVGRVSHNVHSHKHRISQWNSVSLGSFGYHAKLLHWWLLKARIC